MEISGEYPKDFRNADSDRLAGSGVCKEKADSTFWRISRVFPDYNAPGIEYGVACGFLTINGVRIPGERVIGHSIKPGWALVPKIYRVVLD